MSAAMDDRLARPSPSAADGALWTGLFSGPLAWFASQQASYALVPWACHNGTLVAIHLVNLVALLLVAVGGAIAWRQWRRTGRQVSDELGPPLGRARFLALMGVALCCLFAGVILAQALGAFFYGPCQR
jgi:TRAP-type C4-dicarboxylate transport system permease small subunit